MRTIGVPSGIGDVSWLYSKFCNLPEKMIWEVADGWPHRTTPFLQMLPQVENSCYGEFNYSDIVEFESINKIGFHPWWKTLASQEYGRMLIECNRHLEMGIPLADWCPDLPTEFHYEIPIANQDANDAVARLMSHPKPWTGISAASYRGSEAWKTWGYDEWSPFLKAWHAEIGGTIFLIGGFWDDLTDSLASDGYPSLVGRTRIGTVIGMLRLFDFYIGFSSGLGILRTVLKKNAFMLWPDHQDALSRSWAPPWMLETDMYVPHLWRDVETVTRRAKLWLNRLKKLNGRESISRGKSSDNEHRSLVEPANGNASGG